MLRIFITGILLLMTSFSFGQNVMYRYEVDTLATEPDRIRAIIRQYEEDRLKEEKTAYLYPVTLRLPKYRITGNLIKTDVPADSIVLDGRSRIYNETGQWEETEYSNGKKLSAKYFDKSHNKITLEEYRRHLPPVRICFDPNFCYLITGTK